MRLLTSRSGVRASLGAPFPSERERIVRIALSSPPAVRQVWQNCLKRWLQAPIRKRADSNPATVTLLIYLRAVRWPYPYLGCAPLPVARASSRDRRPQLANETAGRLAKHVRPQRAAASAAGCAARPLVYGGFGDGLLR